jgi:hypothetical protein
MSNVIDGRADLMLETVVCDGCAGVYALAEQYITRRRMDGVAWNCPYCCCSYGFGDTIEKQLRRQLEQTAAQREAARAEAQRQRYRAQHEARRGAAARGQVTKLKRRVAAGQCPSCSDTFADLAAHMSAQHPEFAEGGTDG